jgi:hypothetical protein
MASGRVIRARWFERVRTRTIPHPLMRDLSIALAVKFLLLAALYYAFFAPQQDGRQQPGSAAVAQALLGHSASLTETRHDQ